MVVGQIDMFLGFFVPEQLQSQPRQVSMRVYIMGLSGEQACLLNGVVKILVYCVGSSASLFTVWERQQARLMCGGWGLSAFTARGSQHACSLHRVVRRACLCTKCGCVRKIF